MGYGTRPHDWKTDELESMRTLSLSYCLRGYPSFLRDPTPHQDKLPILQTK
jgi:hypothetical protein